MASFAADTTSTRIEAGRYATTVRPGWDILGNTNGGYLLALAARAMADEAGRPDPVTITAHYLNPVGTAPIEIAARVVKSGKRFATVSALVATADKPLLQLLGTFGDLGDAIVAAERVDSTPPELPAPEDCVQLQQGPGFGPAIMDRFDLRLHPEDAGFARRQPSGHPRMRGWFRLLDDEPMDSFALLLAVDAFPPTIFNTDLPRGWTPTLELTAHIRARPAPGWLRAGFSTRFVSSGFLEEDSEIWDEQGRLVAQSRQLALLSRPRQ